MFQPDLLKGKRVLAILAALAALSGTSPGHAAAAKQEPFVHSWQGEFPKTDFFQHAVPLDQLYDVVHRDAVPAVDRPKIVSLRDAYGIGDWEPVVTLSIGGERRAYPIQLLSWHEVVNDTVGGVPVAVTYSPLCNSIIVYDRRVDGQALTFGVTGRLRDANQVMYDKETESWWQQYTGMAIVGGFTGQRLKPVAARIESFIRFRNGGGDGTVVMPRSPAMRQYGQNPFPYYDSREKPDRSFEGALPAGIAPLARLVSVGDQAWPLDRVRREKTIEADGLVIGWQPGQASALDQVMISNGRDVGNVTVQRRTPGGLEDVPYNVSFAFAFYAFYPDGAIHAGK
jgi:hypothetical protein